MLDIIVWEAKDGEISAAFVSALSTAGVEALEVVFQGVEVIYVAGASALVMGPQEFLQRLPKGVEAYFYNREGASMIDLKDIVSNRLQ